MFIDKVKIKVISGSGGNGIVAWRREKFVPKGGPAGGDGGKGGDIFLVADEEISTLLDFKYKSRFVAESGENGKNKNQQGKTGNDIVIKVPLGTVVRDLKTDKVIGDLTDSAQRLIVATGGRGGRGNARFVSSIRRAPQFCEPGEPGIERNLELELKLIADIGLLGLPNAGKSTLISVISAAKPKIADYPFTTLTPNLGVIKKPDGDGVVVADIPGLIEGASEGIGLGLEFLRHIERTRLLVHIVDLTEQDPIKNYNIINNELKKYGKDLINLPQVIALNKVDASELDKADKIKEYFKERANEVFVISAVTKQGIKELVNYLIEKLKHIPQRRLEFKIEEDLEAYNHDDSKFFVYKEKKVYIVEGGKVERLVSVTDLRNSEAVFRLYNILNAMGVYEKLKSAGTKEGDIFRIGGNEFVYRD